LPELPGVAQALTDLTNLTRLSLEGCGDAVGDLAATAIALSCKELQHRDLRSCNLRSLECLAVMAQLRRLQELRLEGNEGFTVQGLELLSQHSSLQVLGFAQNSVVTTTELPGPAAILHVEVMVIYSFIRELWRSHSVMEVVHSTLSSRVRLTVI
jgi:hypothetical protein